MHKLVVSCFVVTAIIFGVYYEMTTSYVRCHLPKEECTIRILTNQQGKTIICVRNKYFGTSSSPFLGTMAARFHFKQWCDEDAQNLTEECLEKFNGTYPGRDPSWPYCPGEQ